VLEIEKEKKKKKTNETHTKHPLKGRNPTGKRRKNEKKNETHPKVGARAARLQRAAAAARDAREVPEGER
jgi:hypothetical protein